MNALSSSWKAELQRAERSVEKTSRDRSGDCESANFVAYLAQLRRMKVEFEKKVQLLMRSSLGCFASAFEPIFERAFDVFFFFFLQSRPSTAYNSRIAAYSFTPDCDTTPGCPLDSSKLLLLQTLFFESSKRCASCYLSSRLCADSWTLSRTRK